MSRKNKNRQPKKTKPKKKNVAIPVTDKKETHCPKDFTLEMSKILSLFKETRGIIMEIETPNKFVFYKEELEDYKSFKDNLISEASKNYKIKTNDQIDYFELIFKG